MNRITLTSFAISVLLFAVPVHAEWQADPSDKQQVKAAELIALVRQKIPAVTEEGPPAGIIFHDDLQGGFSFPGEGLPGDDHRPGIDRKDPRGLVYAPGGDMIFIPDREVGEKLADGQNTHGRQGFMVSRPDPFQAVDRLLQLPQKHSGSEPHDKGHQVGNPEAQGHPADKENPR